jgi:hypothetical protein
VIGSHVGQGNVVWQAGLKKWDAVPVKNLAGLLFNRVCLDTCHWPCHQHVCITVVVSSADQAEESWHLMSKGGPLSLLSHSFSLDSTVGLCSDN